MKIQDLQLLFEYNHWANERVLRYAARLTTRQLNAPAKLGQGSVLQALVHIVDVEWSWRRACQEGHLPADYLTVEQFPTIPALRVYWRDDMAQTMAYLAILTDQTVHQAVQYDWPRARPRKKMLWHILVHIVNHGTHHRSEVSHYLATCGHSPGSMDFLNFVTKRKA
jgi:uncharacterized damage-inducible protein DinB